MTEPDEPFLEPERNLKIPPPLDPHLASVTLRTGANNPNDFFDLTLSAAFGIEYVRLLSGEDEIEVQISIQKAEIKLDAVNCTLHARAESHREGWVGERNERRERNKDLGASAGARVSSDGVKSPSAGAKAAIGKKEEDAEDLRSTVIPWRLQSSEVIQLGYLPEFDRDLAGRIIDEDINVRVTPNDLASSVGVLARVRVRERWIKIIDVKAIKATERFSGFIRGLAGNDPKVVKRREYFEKLLAHLVHNNLQDSEETKDATLAASAMVFSPVEEKTRGLPVPNAPPAIAIDPTAVERFMLTEVGAEADYLRGLGVEVDELVQDPPSYVEIWRSSSNIRGSYKVIRANLLSEAFSSAFGLQVNVTEIEGGLLGRWSITVGSEEHDPIIAPEIIELLEKDVAPWAAAEIALTSGMLTKGEEAYRIAQALGFEFGYQSFIKRMKSSSYKSGYGYLMSIHSIFSELNSVHLLKDFAGTSILWNAPTTSGMSGV